MIEFPSKWYDFTTHKEIKRLRQDFNDKKTMKVQFAVSIIVAILSFFLSEFVSQQQCWVQVCIVCGLCLSIALVFLLPSIVSRLRLRRRCNVIVEGKDAIAIFDDEIVYDALVACQYYNSIAIIPDNEVASEMREFYSIEVEYYVMKVIDNLSKLSARKYTLVGKGKYQISAKRVRNVVKMIDMLVQLSGIVMDDASRTTLDDWKNEG